MLDKKVLTNPSYLCSRPSGLLKDLKMSSSAKATSPQSPGQRIKGAPKDLPAGNSSASDKSVARTRRHTSFQMFPAQLPVPVELLSIIFSYCLPAKPSRPTSNEAPLLLCQVCNGWRQAAIGMGGLWSSIALSARPEVKRTMLSLLELYISRSRETAFTAKLGLFEFSGTGSLLLHRSSGSGRAILRAISTHSDQLQELSLDELVLSPGELSMFEVFSPKSLPSLQTFCIRIIDGHPFRYIACLPQKVGTWMKGFHELPSLLSIQITLHTWALSLTNFPFPWSQLRNIEININANLLSNVVELLALCSSLRTLEITVLEREGTPDLAVLHFPIRTIPVPVPSLRKLDIMCEFAIGNLLSCLAFKNLEQLKLDHLPYNVSPSETLEMCPTTHVTNICSLPTLRNLQLSQVQLSTPDLKQCLSQLPDLLELGVIF